MLLYEPNLPGLFVAQVEQKGAYEGLASLSITHIFTTRKCGEGFGPNPKGKVYPRCSLASSLLTFFPRRQFTGANAFTIYTNTVSK